MVKAARAAVAAAGGGRDGAIDPASRSGLEQAGISSYLDSER